MQWARLLQLKIPVRTVLIRYSADRNVPRDLSADEWAATAELCQVLLPIVKIQRFLSGSSYPTISALYPLIKVKTNQLIELKLEQEMGTLLPSTLCNAPCSPPRPLRLTLFTPFPCCSA